VKSQTKNKCKPAERARAESRASQKFDRELFKLKLSELERRMQIKSAEINTKAAVVARLESGSVLAHILDGQTALIFEWLREVGRIAREILQNQGEAVTPTFVRDILVPEAMTLIETRAGVVKRATDLATPEAETPPSEDLNKMVARWVMEFEAEVANRYEIEARELEGLARASAERVGEARVRIAQNQPIGDLQSAANKPAQMSDHKITAPLPATWEELRKQNSVSQKQAAEFLKCHTRTVRRRIEHKELGSSSKGRIVCDERLRHQIRQVHGEHVLR
jgi:hypothetical protein